MGKNKIAQTTGKKIFIGFFIVLALFFSIYFIRAIPKVYDYNTNGTITNQSNNELNFNITEENMKNVTLYWNETNTSLFFNKDPSLVGYWSMDYYNATGVFDNSSYNLFASFKNNTGTNNIINGKFGTAIKFNGINETISLSGWTDPQNCTYSFWLNNSGTDQRRLGRLGRTYIWINGSGAVAFTYYNGTTYPSAGYINSINNVYNYFAATEVLQGTQMNVTNYYNGNFVSSILLPGSKLSAGGGDLGTNDNFWTQGMIGSIDEFKVWNRTLSSDEIKTDYDSTNNKLNYIFTNLSVGQHSYRVYAIDSLGVMNIVTRNFWVDLNPVHFIVKQIKHIFLKKTGKITITS